MNNDDPILNDQPPPAQELHHGNQEAEGSAEQANNLSDEITAALGRMLTHRYSRHREQRRQAYETTRFAYEDLGDKLKRF